jgi:transposase InsO family protein
MKYIFIKDNRSTFRLKKMCQVFAVSKSGYYAWRKRAKSKTQRANELLQAKIDEIFHGNHQRYGSRRIWFELRLRGIFCSKNRVARLMRQVGFKSRRTRKFKTTTNSKHKLPIAPNLINKNFVVHQPDRVWVSDITYLWTWEGWMYLAVNIDLNSRQVVGWAMSTRINKELVLSAIIQAIGRRKPNPGLIFHSDRGSQYASYEVGKLLQKHQIIQSMSNKGDCYDNAVSESFFATLKLELVYPDFFKTRLEARSKVFEYIEIFYNRQRLHSTLKYMSPAQFEKVKPAA